MCLQWFALYNFVWYSNFFLQTKRKKKKNSAKVLLFEIWKIKNRTWYQQHNNTDRQKKLFTQLDFYFKWTMTRWDPVDKNTFEFSFIFVEFFKRKTFTIFGKIAPICGSEDSDLTSDSSTKMSVALDSVMETQAAQLNLLLYHMYRPYFNGRIFNNLLLYHMYRPYFNGRINNTEFMINLNTVDFF